MDKEIQDILDLFTEINAIPRKSKHEKQISDWLMAWAKEHRFQAKRDKLLNVLINVPATPGYENRPVVILQGHMDMVCEKTPDSSHDFSKDPIKVLIDGDWVHADQTTLGADNGIAIAIALKIASNPSIKHPALELLFTVDEETGLTGASGLSSDFLRGKILLNIDSEDDKKFTIGCAGGRDTNITFQRDMEDINSSKAYSISISGLSGGHSGSDIHKGRANANKLLGRVLDHIYRDVNELQLISISGGSAHNAIPRDAKALFVLPSVISDPASRYESFFLALQQEYKTTDPGLCIQIKQLTESPPKAYSRPLTTRIIHTLMALPHGVANMSATIPNRVETSSNVATLTEDEDNLTLHTSQRSSVMSRLDEITRRIESVGFLADAHVVSGTGYPAWQPNMDSPLLKKCIAVYKRVHGKEPLIEVIHAGLECGVIGAKYPGMDMISFGPLIVNAHSPEEKMSLSSLEKVWKFIKPLLEEL
ncbi:MAG: aminoacyl-histidine dipeptidase [Candidatus Marinimicrobia bacterium]|nr:aminoacyl-histidine dipeptidase [Candidatus Neomarinimicrobiota bacterium]